MNSLIQLNYYNMKINFNYDRIVILQNRWRVGEPYHARKH